MTGGTGPDYTTIVGVKRTETGYVPGETIYTGDQIVSSDISRITREWRPKDKAAQRFKDDVIRRIEQIFNNTSTGTGGGEDDEESGGGTSPDLFFDSGYFYLKAGVKGDPSHEHTIKHNLGQIPTRFTIFFCSVQNPSFDPDHPVLLVSPNVVYDGYTEWCGFWVNFPTTNTMVLTSVKDRILYPGPTAATDGYFRVLIWK
jgi:hypothetical protein